MNKLKAIFLPEQPGKLQYGAWYAFLLLWMQGEALLSIFWILSLLLSLPYLKLGLQTIRPYRWLWISISAYVLIRISSVAYAIDPKLALLGITDDLRIFTIGLLCLIYIQNTQPLKKSLLITLGGFTFLAWHALILHWSSFQSFSPAGITNVEFGSLAHINYTAAYTSVLLFSLLVSVFHFHKKYILPIVLLALPLFVMQGPLSSRTTLLILPIICGLYFLYKSSLFKAISIIIVLSSISFFSLSQTDGALNQFNDINNPIENLSIKARIADWHILYEVWKDHPMGIGPKNFIAVDMNSYKEWIATHISKEMVQKALNIHPKHVEDNFKDINLNEPLHHIITDPHNHYISIFVENGPLGLLSFLAWLGALFYVSAKNLKHRNKSVSALAEASFGGLLIMAGCSIMTSLFYQSGGIITILLLTFLISSIQIAGKRENALPEPDGSATR